MNAIFAQLPIRALSTREPIEHNKQVLTPTENSANGPDDFTGILVDGSVLKT